ncbi:RNA polymerase sigma factor (sigma-70 family) [Flavobacterium sp. 1]|uniref:RNA polymerase sigma factor n=1 Tax=Flavobacterium sp. 1 TaxID=2035200 RepID=UPI000C2375F9|nr:sigma-70 family RNA polymerase sigma factor [Flavobacterium sp. 1]PJJ07110.1 RNA polymerase sigma factor (sigma-70 family) [Flavobacterium sp. 1]
MKIQFNHTYILDDFTLWNNLKTGDEKAFSILFEKYYSDLVRYGNSLCSYDDRVQDCVQDVFTDIWVYRESLSDNVIIKAYLLSSVRKRIARLYQRDPFFKKESNIETTEFLFDFSIEQQLIDDETTAEKVLQLNMLINSLPSRQKEALYLRYHQQLTVDQIAEIMSVNYQSASNILFRGIQNLRKDWKENISIILILSSSYI